MNRRSMRGRRSLAALGWGALIFLLGQVSLGIFLDRFCPLYRFPSARDVLASLELQPSAPRLLFLGSSRFGCAVDAGEISRLLASSVPAHPPWRAFNASVPGGDPISAERLLDECLGRGHRPDWVVLELSPENLNYPGPWLPLHTPRQLGWFAFPSHVVEVTRTRSLPRYLGSLLLPGLVHNERIRERAWQRLQALTAPRTIPAGDSRSEEAGPLDWDRILRIPRTTLAQDRLPEVRKADAARAWLRNYQIRGVGPAALARVLARCRDERLGVVVVLPPVAEAHRREYVPAIEEAFARHLAGLRREYGFEVVDARDWLPDAFFHDSSHADARSGQPYFSRLLTHRVLLNLIRQAPHRMAREFPRREREVVP